MRRHSELVEDAVGGVNPGVDPRHFLEALPARDEHQAICAHPERGRESVDLAQLPPPKVFHRLVRDDADARQKPFVQQETCRSWGARCAVKMDQRMH